MPFVVARHIDSAVVKELLTVCPPGYRECAKPQNHGFRRLVIHFKGIPKPYQHTENLGILRSLSRDIGQKPKISDFGLFT